MNKVLKMFLEYFDSDLKAPEVTKPKTEASESINPDAACDLNSFGFLWEPGTLFWTSCFGTRKKIDEVAKEILAARGVFKIKANK